MKRLLPSGRELAPVLALFALCLSFFWKMLFTNLIVARGDLFNYFYPYRDYAAAAVREGRLPLWNPYLFMGAPFIANSQAGFFYPLNLATSWLEVTRAVNLSIVAHVCIAAIGAYAFARRLGASLFAALLGGVSFGLGGYLGAQVEHFNQLQALAWLPWLWLVYDRAAAAQSRSRWIQRSALVGLLVGLMLLAGHTQSVFIALVGLTAYALWPAIERWRAPRQALRTALTRLTPIVVAALTGALLAAVQLLPTAELAGFSPRGGGLSTNEAVSFSLDPRLIGRAFLPDYEGALPAGSEFTAFFGVSALVLMLVGVLAGWLSNPPPNHPTTQPPNHPNSQVLRSVTVVAIIGLFLALGGFNPIYYALVRFVPGFDLFRAPARWLALFAFAGSMLAALGLDLLGRRLTRMTQMLPLAFIALLVSATFIAGGITPAGAAGPVGTPGLTSVILWSASAILTFLASSRLQRPTPNVQRPTSSLQPPISNLQLLLTIACTLELFIASRALPYNARLTAPDALTDLRPSLTQLLVGATGTPPARFLSISDILFDPGDSAELASIFANQLSPEAYFDLLVASKQKEIAAPNLPLYYHLPAIDGYDGGLLPLRHYLALQRLLLPPDAIQSDGRLREQLKAIPDARWLDLLNVKYVITDKVRDRWLDGVFYDLQFATRLEPGQAVSNNLLPVFDANALGLVYSQPASDAVLGEVNVLFFDGTTLSLPLTHRPIETEDGLSVVRLRWDEAKRVDTVDVRGIAGLTLNGAALIDERSGTFQSFVLAKDGRFRLVHSGDVKVYHNLDALPRAFVVPEARSAVSDDEAIALMRDPGFDPSRTVILNQEDGSWLYHIAVLTRRAVRITEYRPEYVAVEVETDGEAHLVLTDAWYPGWTATVDSEPAAIERADVYFRAVSITAGAHRVEFRYEPLTVRVGVAISIGAWMIVIGVMVVLHVRHRT